MKTTTKQNENTNKVVNESAKAITKKEIHAAFKAVREIENESTKSPYVWIRRMNSKGWVDSQSDKEKYAKALEVIDAQKWDLGLLDFFGGCVSTFKRIATREESECLFDFVGSNIADDLKGIVIPCPHEIKRHNYKTKKVEICVDLLQWTFEKPATCAKPCWVLSKEIKSFLPTIILDNAKQKAIREFEYQKAQNDKDSARAKEQKRAERAARAAEKKARKETQTTWDKFVAQVGLTKATEIMKTLQANMK